MDFPWNAGHDALRVLISFALVLPVGWYREKEGHTIGVRTFPLVAVASCGYVLLGTAPGMTADSQSRIIQFTNDRPHKRAGTPSIMHGLQ